MAAASVPQRYPNLRNEHARARARACRRCRRRRRNNARAPPTASPFDEELKRRQRAAARFKVSFRAARPLVNAEAEFYRKGKKNNDARRSNACKNERRRLRSQQKQTTIADRMFAVGNLTKLFFDRVFAASLQRGALLKTTVALLTLNNTPSLAEKNCAPKCQTTRQVKAKHRRKKTTKLFVGNRARGTDEQKKLLSNL